MASFKVGDLVQLKSGGPSMTVDAIYTGYLSCTWFAGKKLERGNFGPETVIPFVEKKAADEDE